MPDDPSGEDRADDARDPGNAGARPENSSGYSIARPRDPSGDPVAPPQDSSDYAVAQPQDSSALPEGLARRKLPTPRRWVNIVFFALTLVTTLYWGFIEYQSFYADDLGPPTLNPLAAPDLLLAGLPYGIAVIAFLLAHEMGHYLACRYYGLKATLPYFIPIPPLITLLPGTMGAVIRILSPIRHRRALFDIAVAGPIAGFVVALPILAFGISQSRVVPAASLGDGFYFEMGEPLVWSALEALFGPDMQAGQELVAHPLAFVGWFAMLVTAMNLLPVGQLDGGHLIYAFLPRGHRAISFGFLAAMLAAGFLYFAGWIVFALMIYFLLGTRHPPLATFESLGTGRKLLALASLAIFVISFMLVPVRLPSLG